MRLIDTETLELLEFWDDKIPEYAILSHTWEEGEVTFQDWHHLSIDDRKKKKGYYKIDMACRKAQKHGLRYLWVDTNCIDKSSSAELSEAINSMFIWYQKASICYVYLADVEPTPEAWQGWKRMTDDYVEEFCRSKWFTRGWTLQELLAPAAMTFYSRDWSKIASRSTLTELISETTRIRTQYLNGDRWYKYASIAQKMSWISRRHTSRIEDMAYCMLGIFDINMPLLYGEGPKSFTRLQEEIIRNSNDQTIFCWTWIDSVPPSWASLLAPCPQAFQHSGNFVSAKLGAPNIKLTYKMTNAGLSIHLPLVQAWSYYLGVLNAKLYGQRHNSDRRVCVPIQGRLDEGQNLRRPMRRLHFPPGPVPISTSWALCQPHVYIRSNPGWPLNRPLASSSLYRKQYSFLLVFGENETLISESMRSGTKSEISPGIRICLLEKTRGDVGFNVFPPSVFDEERSLITVERTSPSSGFLIQTRIETESLGFRWHNLFIGVNFRSSHVHRFCGVVPDSIYYEATDKDKLLERLLSTTEETSQECDVGWGHGIKITMREEAVAGFGSICLVYITCQPMDAGSNDDGSGYASDEAVGDGHRNKILRSHRLFECLE